MRLMRTPKKMDEGVKPWVSMAEALGWGMTSRPSMTVTGGGTATGGAEPFGNAARRGMERARGEGEWAFERPATTVQGDPRLTGPGHRCMTKDCHGREATSMFGTPGSVRISTEEAAILQTFGILYPWRGTKTKIYEQIGNAIPPLLAQALLRQVS